MANLGVVLSGGGIRGVAHIGMLKALEEQGLLADIEVAVGSSAGAIMAAMFGLGYTPDAMWEAWQHDVWKMFGGHPSAGAAEDWNVSGALDVIAHGFDLSRFRGVFKGDHLLQALEKYLVRDPQGTDVRPTRPQLPFYVIATNFDSGEQTVWHFKPPGGFAAELAAPAELERATGRAAHWEVHENDDPTIVQFPTVAQTVRCSASIPFIFTPGHAPIQYQGQPVANDDYTDGGVRDGYSLGTAVKLDHCTRIIGMFLGSVDPHARKPWNGLADLALRSIDQMSRTVFEADQDDDQIRRTDIRTLVPHFSGSIADFDVEKMPQIYNAGLALTREFLQRVKATAGTLTWDTIFATQHLTAPGPGRIRAAQTPAAAPGAIAPAPDTKYYIYQQTVTGDE